MKRTKRICLGWILILSILAEMGCEDRSVTKSDLAIIDAPSAIGTQENPQLRLEYELRQLVNPVTHAIPALIHHDEISYAQRQWVKHRASARVNQSEWKPLGPTNVGGRTRALAIDVTDENILLAGGVSGGMYRSTNRGNNWTRTTSPSALNSVTCLVQDKRSGHEKEWYYGTGELRGNSSRSIGAPLRGDGIYRSVDGGVSWDILPSTSNDRPEDFESPFNYVWSIAIDPEGVIYAALYGCIVRSEDQGASWEVVLGPDLLHPESLTPPIEDLNDSGAPFYTNVMITPSGKIYATLSSFTALGYHTRYAGYYVYDPATDTWDSITPADLPLVHHRTVMAFAPSNEDALYFLTDGDQLSLWKYNQNRWLDRSINLPGVSDTLPALDTQDGYNLIVRVHPTDEDVVYIGGTNLYRSDNGFRGPNSAWIGGYDPEGSGGTKYPNHHPDQHELLFFSSNPNQMLSANDGGVRYTSDNLSNTPDWSVLNNGYVSSQFYTIALSRDVGSLRAIGGMQDNGTYMKTLGNANTPWTEILGGDGSYAATTPGEVYWYASFQQGQTFRLSLNAQNNLTSFAEVDPVGGENYLFINPFVLDPNNYNRMYMAGGSVVWRNNNLSQIPAGVQEPTSVNWEKIESTELPFPSVSAMDVSTSPANVLYFGTTLGTVFKTIAAHTDTAETFFVYQQVVTDEDGERVSGNISSVAIDPLDADRMMFTYSNYYFPSVFFTSDGGQTVVDVSGNLEEHADGRGGGPSVRWCEIIPLADGEYKYFAATSVGLYSTTELDGSATLWVQEAHESIGNSVIRMTDYRSSDGTFIVATHGNGTFETTIDDYLNYDEKKDPVEKLTVINAYPNPFDTEITVRCEIPESGRVRVQVLNSTGQIVRTLLDAEQLAGEVSVSWDGSNSGGAEVDDGLYFYRINYGSSVRTGKMIYLR
ncbi:hypothetical protein BFP72_11500 [Reichenbachiella sp. 5M10]|uniref:FlgD immunoglobulin-like domain containing protein n=1 Tax=Reichenbachiella sp. 5M10 TaxID=1889772 RepID=UPI000C14A090|nr:FlgD immunoglobulin-like domain containing protein [Reichenbachiella sp. 5M10]PIB35976.1 hypothetical protein BFP72_11500 [Reichenbachiella sp. 5M10]